MTTPKNEVVWEENQKLRADNEALRNLLEAIAASDIPMPSMGDFGDLHRWTQQRGDRLGVVAKWADLDGIDDKYFAPIVNAYAESIRKYCPPIAEQPGEGVPA